MKMPQTEKENLSQNKIAISKGVFSFHTKQQFNQFFINSNLKLFKTKYFPGIGGRKQWFVIELPLFIHEKI